VTDDEPRAKSPGDIARRLHGEGWQDDEIVELFARAKRAVDLEDGDLKWVRGMIGTLHQERVIREWLAGLRDARPRRSRPEPTASPEDAARAFEETGSERKAARAIGVSKTHLRRLLGKET
jgi:hypothetical protein